MMMIKLVCIDIWNVQILFSKENCRLDLHCISNFFMYPSVEKYIRHMQGFPCYITSEVVALLIIDTTLPQICCVVAILTMHGFYFTTFHH